MSVLLQIASGAWLETEANDLALVSGHSSTRSALDLLLNLIFIPAPPTSALSTTMRTTFNVESQQITVLTVGEQLKIAFAELAGLELETDSAAHAIVAVMHSGKRVLLMLPQNNLLNVQEALHEITSVIGPAAANTSPRA
jgi:hypothetical protein